MKSARLKSCLSMLLAAAIVSGVPGLDFYQALAEKGEQDRPGVSTATRRELRLPLERKLAEPAGDDGELIDGEPAADAADIALEAGRLSATLESAASQSARDAGSSPADEGLDRAVAHEPLDPTRTLRQIGLDGALEGAHYPELFDHWLEENPRMEVREGGEEVPGALSEEVIPSTVALARSRNPFLSGVIFGEKVRDAELEDNRHYDGVAAFDLASLVDETGKLRPEALRSLEQLYLLRIKTVLWTSATRERLEKMPERPWRHFDRVITRENFAPALGDDHPGLVWKDLSQLGYDWIVDTNSRLSSLAFEKKFVHFKVDPFDPKEPHQADFGQAIDDILALVRLRDLKRTPAGQPVRFLRLAYDRDEIRALAEQGPVSVINRSPITLSHGQVTRSSGGAAPAIRGFVIAAANTPDEAAAARQGMVVQAGDTAVLFVDIPRPIMERYYNGFANRWLWPLLHGKDVVEEFYGEGASIPEMSDDYEDGYRKANEIFADKILDLLGDDFNGSVSIEDYHLYPLALKLRQRGFKGVLDHFTHIPWPRWDGYLSELSDFNKYMLRQIVQGMLADDIVEFHTQEYVKNFVDTARNLLGVETREIAPDFFELTYRAPNRVYKTVVRSMPISVEVETLLSEMQSKEAREQFETLGRLAAERTLISNAGARVDPTKGQPESLEAYYELLKRDYGRQAPPPPAQGWLQRIRRWIFGAPRPPLYYAGFMMSRGSIAEYANQQERVLYWARKINAEFSPGRWDGIIRSQEDREKLKTLSADQLPYLILELGGMPHPLVLATLAATNRPGGRRGVGDVTPLADGMNLVAKEYVLAAANEWRLAGPGWKQWVAWSRQRIARLWGVGAVLMLTAAPSVRADGVRAGVGVGAYAELAPYSLTLNNPTSSRAGIEERIELLRRAMAAANGEAPAPKAEDGFAQIQRNDLSDWASARLQARLLARGPPDSTAAVISGGSRALRWIAAPAYRWTALGLLAALGSAAAPWIAGHYQALATISGWAGTVTFLFFPFVLVLETYRNRAITDESAAASPMVRRLGAVFGSVRQRLGRRFKRLDDILNFALPAAKDRETARERNEGVSMLSHSVSVLNNLVGFPALLATHSFPMISNAAIGAFGPVFILHNLRRSTRLRGWQSALIWAVFAAIPLSLFSDYWILAQPWLMSKLGEYATYISFLFYLPQIGKNFQALLALRSARTAAERTAAIEKLRGVPMLYLFIGLLGNLLMLPAIMVSGQWFHLLGGGVAVASLAVLLSQRLAAELIEGQVAGQTFAAAVLWITVMLASAPRSIAQLWN